MGKTDVVRTSKFSSFCRTQGFNMPFSEGKIVQWHEASEHPVTKKWSIIKVRREPSLSVEGEFDDVIELLEDQSDLSYVSCLEALAEFEQSSFAMKFQAVSPSPDDLKGQYYRNLALHDGLIFDSFGKVHVSENGHLTKTSGRFPAKDRDALMTACDKKPEGVLQKRLSDAGVLKKMFTASVDTKPAPSRDIIANVKGEKDIKRIQDYFSYMSGLLQRLRYSRISRIKFINPSLTGGQAWINGVKQIEGRYNFTYRLGRAEHDRKPFKLDDINVYSGALCLEVVRDHFHGKIVPKFAPILKASLPDNFQSVLKSRG